eukprot:Rmarinus@m.16960
MGASLQFRSTLLVITCMLFAILAQTLPIYLFPNRQVLDTYDQLAAFKYGLHATSAYCNVTEFDCGPCKGLPDFQLEAVFSNEDENTFGYLGYYPSIGEAVIAFRGTQFASLRNWVDNINFYTAEVYPEIEGAYVHGGFYKAFNSIRDDVRSAVATMAMNKPVEKLHITGHSLGGAIATICATDLTLYRLEEYGKADKSGIPLPPVAGLYTFGSPRVGNSVFHDFFDANVAESWRLVHRRDIVPHLPPHSLHFQHVSREVWYNDDDALAYEVCSGTGEDSACSASLWVALSVSDHMQYLGISMGTYCDTPPPIPPQVAQLFSDRGSTHPGMDLSLFTVEEVSELAYPDLDRDLDTLQLISKEG